VTEAYGEYFLAELIA
jgi:hypothetical protein